MLRRAEWVCVCGWVVRVCYSFSESLSTRYLAEDDDDDDDGCALRFLAAFAALMAPSLAAVLGVARAEHTADGKGPGCVQLRVALDSDTLA